VFSHYVDNVFRVMIQLQPKPRHYVPKQPIEDYGFLGYCHSCGQFQTVDWRSLGRVSCRSGQCAPAPVVSGPMWLGELHDANWLKSLRDLAESKVWDDVAGLCALWRSEIGMPPYFYTLGEVGRRGQMDIPRRDRLAQALIEQGYRFSRTAIHPEGFKTDATLATCVALMQRR
jgi:tRNA (guanine26-N2/guanine27-N2)-dimethyltransferase